MDSRVVALRAAVDLYRDLGHGQPPEILDDVLQLAERIKTWLEQEDA